MALYESLIDRARELTGSSLAALPPLDAWEAALPARRRQWREMLGLDPLPERTDLRPVVTGVLDRGHYVVEKLHFQPLPGCYVAANVYLPRRIETPVPVVVYLCGHSARGKFHYQLHPRWFGEHGYAAIVLDPIQVGENGGFHHGTHRKGWWHWYSQGYTPAGVEVWAAMRALDYMATRPEVDARRAGITGLSGGGSVSWFAGAADERFAVVAPVCQTGTVYQHIAERTLDGHCDCTFWVNLYGWDFAGVAALIAPRPLFVGATRGDMLFRPYGYRHVVDRARDVYRLYGDDERVALVEDDGPHGYTRSIRLALFAWFERFLKGVESPCDPLTGAPALDDLATDPEPDDALAVYPDRRPPPDDRLVEVDRRFMSLPDGPPAIPIDAGAAAVRSWWQAEQRSALLRLRSGPFRTIPESPAALLPAAVETRRDGQTRTMTYRSFAFETEPGLTVHARLAMPAAGPTRPSLVVTTLPPDARTPYGMGGAGLTGERGVEPAGAAAGAVEVRGTGATSLGPGLEWTVRRAYPLLGQTLPERQTFDLLRGVALLRREAAPASLALYGRGVPAAVALYAALLDPAVDEVILDAPVATHWESGPEFLGVLRIGDLPYNAALLFPRPITFVGEVPEPYRWTRDLYAACGAPDRFRVVPDLAAWRPAGARGEVTP